MSDEDRYETVLALREIWDSLRHLPPAQTGLDGYHNDQLLKAIEIVKP